MRNLYVSAVFRRKLRFKDFIPIWNKILKVDYIFNKRKLYNCVTSWLNKIDEKRLDL